MITKVAKTSVCECICIRVLGTVAAFEGFELNECVYVTDRER